MSEQIRLVLADAPTLFRRCLASVLGRQHGLQVVGQAATAGEAVAQTRSLQPDVVVVDLDIPEGGAHLPADLCRAAQSAGILVLTIGDAGAASQTLQAGAHGFLDKNCEIQDLVRAIERVHAGDVVVAAGPANSFLRELEKGTARADGADRGLTSRELEVLRLVAQGRTNGDIARELFITEHTVKGHLAKILNKLALENRVQLAAYAMRNGLAETPPTDGGAPTNRTAGLDQMTPLSSYCKTPQTSLALQRDGK